MLALHCQRQLGLLLTADALLSGLKCVAIALHCHHLVH